MSGDVTYGALERLTNMPGRDDPQGDRIAGQYYYDVELTGGSITGITPSGLPTPLAIADGGTAATTAQGARNNLLPAQAGHAGEVLKTDGTNVSWSADIDTGITQLTGDVTAGPGSGSQVATLATVNANTGSFGSSTSIPSFTVNGKGLVTAASGNVVVAPAGTLTGTTLAPNVVSSSLTSVGVLTSGTWNASIIDVAYGGTGRNTGANAYGLIAAGTTATGPQQTLSVGDTTDILVGGGPASLPVWTTSTGTGAPVRATSPTLTGTPLSTTASAGTNSTQIATTAFVQANKGPALDTPQSTTSGTSKTFTAPATAKQIRVMLNGVSTNGTSLPLLRIGTGGAPTTSGYLAIGSFISGTNSCGILTSTVGFLIPSADAAAILTGSFTLSLMNSSTNLWVVNGWFGQSTANFSLRVDGSIALSGVLDTITFTTQNGTDVFDSGSINVSYL